MCISGGARARDRHPRQSLAEGVRSRHASVDGRGLKGRVFEVNVARSPLQRSERLAEFWRVTKRADQRGASAGASEDM
jgi:hypothetical protein